MKNIMKNSKIVLISTISATMTACQSMGTSGITARDRPPKQLYSDCKNDESKEYNACMEQVDRFDRLQLFALLHKSKGDDKKITKEDVGKEHTLPDKAVTGEDINEVHKELWRMMPDLLSNLDDSQKEIVQSSNALVIQKIVPQIKEKSYKDAKHWLALQLYHPNVTDAATWDAINKKAGEKYFVSPKGYVGPIGHPRMGIPMRVAEYTKIKVEEPQ